MQYHDTHVPSKFGAVLGTLGYVITQIMEFVPKPTEFLPALITAGSCAAFGWLITKIMNKISEWVFKKK